MPANVFEFDEEWFIPASPEAVWDVLADARLLPEWWKGVYLQVEPIGEDRYRALARGFLPYRLRFTLASTAAERPRRIEVRTEGDFIGIWRATLTPRDGGTQVAIDWRVRVEKGVVRYLAPLLKPLFALNHNWTTPRGEAGLTAYLAERGLVDPETAARAHRPAPAPSEGRSATLVAVPIAMAVAAGLVYFFWRRRRGGGGRG